MSNRKREYRYKRVYPVNTIIEFKGSMDGLRYGAIMFDTCRKQFVYDRLARRVRLFNLTRGDNGVEVPDTDPDRLALALAMVEAEWARGAARSSTCDHISCEQRVDSQSQIALHGVL